MHWPILCCCNKIPEAGYLSKERRLIVSHCLGDLRDLFGVYDRAVADGITVAGACVEEISREVSGLFTATPP